MPEWEPKGTNIYLKQSPKMWINQSPQLPDDVGQLICSLLDPLRHHSHKTKTSPPSKARRWHWVNSSAAYLTHGGTLSIKPKKALRSKLEKQTWNNSAMEAILTKLNSNENGHKKTPQIKAKIRVAHTLRHHLNHSKNDNLCQWSYPWMGNT